ncbi:hypothetical protein RAC89_06045 [Paenibacillus sp. GD4]|jgi:hypothetical protein|uniref:hypothetical protein n=1 Tax=Paenibacillus sp. GD4 TaxID=3068890 RepID=UPI002796DA27|nr:hypothetical protein [Paenibacillus sp. GD4]MDQ1910057.1 hypothetical protein [Paenibacillus sp. GD4]
MQIHVYDEIHGSGQLTVQEMASLAGGGFALQERVPSVSGKAFDLKRWYAGWRGQQGGENDRLPVLLQVEAADEFQATIPWDQLDQACFLYEQEDGIPLKKGFPLRLYVPDGSSECLNVKSVVTLRLGYEGLAPEEATYGFKNTVSLDDLKLRK